MAKAAHVVHVAHVVFALSLLFAVGSALGSPKSVVASLMKRAPDLLPPSQDPFYTAPAGYEAAAPGAVLRVRSARGNLTQISANIGSAYNILYRTTDSNYRPSWAVTTLYVPKTAPKLNATSSSTNSTAGAAGAALLSYLVPC